MDPSVLGAPRPFAGGESAPRGLCGDLLCDVDCVHRILCQGLQLLKKKVKKNHVSNGEEQCLQVNGYSDVVISGRTVPIVRYIDWITTTPLMLFELCIIGGAEKHTTILVIGCNLIMHATGIVSAMVVPKEKVKVKYSWFTLAVLCFILMVFALHSDVARGTVEDRPKDVQELFLHLEWLTVISWSWYPVVVLLGRAHFGILSKGMEDALLCILVAWLFDHQSVLLRPRIGFSLSKRPKAHPGLHCEAWDGRLCGCKLHCPRGTVSCKRQVSSTARKLEKPVHIPFLIQSFALSHSILQNLGWSPTPLVL